MPEPAAASAERERLAREDGRRQAAALLRLSESVSRYAAGQVSDGLSPAEARRAVIEAAGALAELARSLRRLAWLDDPAERRAVARELAADGMSRRDVADRLGVSETSVRNYVRGRGPAPALTTARPGARRGARPAAEGGR